MSDSDAAGRIRLLTPDTRHLNTTGNRYPYGVDQRRALWTRIFTLNLSPFVYFVFFVVKINIMLFWQLPTNSFILYFPDISPGGPRDEYAYFFPAGSR